MTVSVGAVLAAIAGAITGALDVRLRTRKSSGGSVVLAAFMGAGIGVAAFAVFLVAGLVVGVLTFSTGPAPGPALVGVIVGCVLLLGIRALLSAVVPRLGLPERRPNEPFTVEDLIEARPRGGSTTMWLGGIGLAALPAIYGLQCLITARGEFGTTLRSSTLTGLPAMALGIGWIGVGMFLHFHFFFGLHPTLTAYSSRGKSIALVVACAGLTIAALWSM